MYREFIVTQLLSVSSALTLLDGNSQWKPAIGHDDLCVGIKGQAPKGYSEFHLVECDSSPGQQWTHDPATGHLYLTSWPDLCATRTKNKLKAVKCGQSPSMQKWQYFESTGRLFLPNTHKCIKIGNGRKQRLRVGSNCRNRIISWGRKAGGDSDVEPVVHVGIVGAGIAGLTSAYELVKLMGNKVKITIYEASDRVGGRTKTVQYKNMRLEDGGTYVDTSHSVMRGMAEELGEELVYRGSPKEGIIYINGETHLGQSWIYAAYEKEITCIKSLEDSQYETVWEDYDYDSSISIMDMMHQCNASDFMIKLTQVSFQSYWATDIEETGAVNMADLWTIDTDNETFHAWDQPGDEAWVFKRGTGGFISSLLSKVLEYNANIHFSTPVTKVAYKPGDSKVKIENSDMGVDVEFDKLILAAPLPAFFDGGSIDISDLQSMTEVQTDYLKHYPMGSSLKIHMLFSQQWWTEPVVNDMMQQALEGSELFYFLNENFHIYWTRDALLCCNKDAFAFDLYFGGSAVKKVLSEGFEVTVNNALSEIAAAFPTSNVTGSFLEYIPGEVWERYPWAKGSYTGAPGPGDEWQFNAIAEASVGNGVYFAGEHWHLDLQGYMEGAAISAKAAAQAIAGQFM